MQKDIWRTSQLIGGQWVDQKGLYIDITADEAKTSESEKIKRNGEIQRIAIINVDESVVVYIDK
jgi:hypothetical protein